MIWGQCTPYQHQTVIKPSIGQPREKTVEEQEKFYADPVFRKRFRAELKGHDRRGQALRS